MELVEDETKSKSRLKRTSFFEDGRNRCRWHVWPWTDRWLIRVPSVYILFTHAGVVHVRLQRLFGFCCVTTRTMAKMPVQAVRCIS